MYNPSAECQQKGKEKNHPVPSAEIQQLKDFIYEASHLAASDPTAEGLRNP